MKCIFDKWSIAVLFILRKMHNKIFVTFHLMILIITIRFWNAWAFWIKLMQSIKSWITSINHSILTNSKAFSIALSNILKYSIKITLFSVRWSHKSQWAKLLTHLMLFLNKYSTNDKFVWPAGISQKWIGEIHCPAIFLH